MRRFIRNGILFTAAILGSVTALYFALPENPHSYLKANIDKRGRIESLSSPKVVFVGGSNIAFGLDSRRVSEAMDMPVVNMGLHGGVGLDFALRQVRRHIGPGDIVVVIPEYQNFTEGDPWGGPALAELLVEDKAAWGAVGWRQIPGLVRNLPVAVQERLHRVLSPAPGAEVFPTPPEEEVYKRSAFNEYGDVVSHLGRPKPNLRLEPIFDGDEKGFQRGLLGSIRGLVRRCEKVGATAVYLPASIRRHDYELAEKVYDRIHARIAEGTGIIMPADPEDYVFRDELFFDSPYHLMAEGRDERTGRVIRDVREAAAREAASR